MARITKDMLLTEAYLQERYLPDSVTKDYYQSVLDKHNTTREQYDSSLIWYGQNANRMADIYDLIQAELTASKAVVDTFLNDSTQRHRIRFQAISSLWSRHERIYIPADQIIWSYGQDLSEDELTSDTLYWTAQVTPPAPDSIAIQLDLVLLGEKDKLYRKIRATRIETSDTSRPLSFTYSIPLPDSLPPISSNTLYLLIEKSRQPLLLQGIQLSKEALPANTTQAPSTTTSRDNDAGELLE